MVRRDCPSSNEAFAICSSRKSLKKSKHRLWRFKAKFLGSLQRPKMLSNPVYQTLCDIGAAHFTTLFTMSALAADPVKDAAFTITKLMHGGEHVCSLCLLNSKHT